jgi:hypothetical protein
MPVPVPFMPAGAKPRGDDFNKLRAQLESQRITGVAGLVGGGFSGGSTLAALGLPPIVRRPNPSASAPWFLTGAIEAGPVAKIYIKPGMVNNFVPTIDMSGTPTSLAAFPAPSITVTGTTGIIELKATIDGAGTITALIAQNVTTASTDTSTNKYKTLGTWTSASGAFTSVTSILNTNQTFRVCNGTAEWY